MIGLGIAVVAATFVFVLPRIADYGEVWSVVKKLSWQQIAALVGATALNLVTFAPPWMVALPGLGFRRAFVLTQASTASTYIAPGGAAVGVGLAVFVVAIVAFTGALATPKLARFVGREAARLANWALGIFRQGPVGWTADSFVRFRNRAVSLLRHRWFVLTLATLAGQLSVFALFFVSLRVLGVSANEVGAVEAFAAWSLTRLLGSLPITPGGLGVVEVGLTTALVGFGGSNAEVVAAVLVYRFLNIVPTLVLGLIAGATWRRLTPARPQRA